MLALLRSAWAYRHFIVSSIRNDLVSQFARSKLGGLWMIINPLVMVAIYAFVLSAVLSAKLPGIDNKYAYAIYLTAGILGWNLFNDMITRCLNLFIQNGNLLKKMVLPKIALPLIATGTALINNLLLFGAIIGIFALLGHPPSWQMLWIPLITVVLVVFSLGIGLIVGVINVFIRDLGQLIPILLQFLFWFTPIVYPASIIPEHMRHYLLLNPMYPVVNAYHDVLAFRQAPDVGHLLMIGASGLVLLAVGLIIVRRASAEMVDVL
ncbi:ABC transporter permease [Gilvimarinus sp. F26214L]|uniref:ABC transporter permease n=1 Tax=Gilvimarinus sp. DZF01 TaxID=3461371 RepID=UPI00404541A7